VKAVKKYGKNNFTKEIIADCQNRKEAHDREKRIVTLASRQLGIDMSTLKYSLK